MHHWMVDFLDSRVLIPWIHFQHAVERYRFDSSCIVRPLFSFVFLFLLSRIDVVGIFSLRGLGRKSLVLERKC